VRTIIDILDSLLERAQRFAAGRGQDLAEVVNAALSEKLGREERPAEIIKPFRMITFGEGGARPGIDLNSNASLFDAMDDELRDPATGEFDLDRLR
jgi:hypothetical protein